VLPLRHVCLNTHSGLWQGIGKSRKHDLNQIKIITEKRFKSNQKSFFKCDLNQNQIIDQIIY